VIIPGRLSKCYSFFLAFPSAVGVGGVGGVCALGVLVRWQVLSVLIVSQRCTGLAACLGLAQNVV
jgi:hypothetical protein